MKERSLTQLGRRRPMGPYDRCRPNADATAESSLAPLADSVDQAYTPTLKLLNLP